MHRVISSALALPLKRRKWIITSSQYKASYPYNASNVKFLSTVNKKIDVEEIGNNRTSKNENSNEEEKIRISNIEGRTKEEIKKTREGLTPQRTILKSIPNRHSRKLPPSIASSEIVDDLSQEMISSPVGSWFTYDSDFTTPEGEDQGFIVSDVWSQKVEFLLRGHSSLLDGSVIRKELQHEELQLPLTDTNTSGTRFHVMQSLLERMEKEAQAYKEAYIVAHSSLEEVSPSSQRQPKIAESEEEQEASFFIGAPPGPTISMYDLVLDAHAISLLPTALSQAQALFKKAAQRHFLNGGPDNTQRHTIPTELTFNAIIRTAANIPYDAASDDSSEQVRDAALNAAFFIFDKMHHSDSTKRNTATYIYMLQMLKKCMPESLVRGNIAHAIFELAVEDRVMDDAIYEELKVNGGGDLYQNWLNHMSQKEVPLDEKWCDNAIRRRYDVNSIMY